MKIKSIGTVFRAWQDTLPREFVDSLAQMLLHSQRTLCGPNEFIDYQWGTVSWFEAMRHEAIERATGDWILFLDTDHIFAPDLLERMLRLYKKHNTPVLSGLYAAKHVADKQPYEDGWLTVPVANTWGPNDSILNLNMTEVDPTAEVVEIGPCGAGCLLVKRDVFKALQKTHPGQAAFGTIPGLSEDYSFFKRCREAGIKTYLAPGIQANHLGARIPIEIHPIHTSKKPPLVGK